MQTLLVLQIHFRIRTFIDELNRKMDLWTQTHSLKLLKGAQKEYEAEVKTKPVDRGNKLLRIMQDTIPKDFCKFNKKFYSWF